MLAARADLDKQLDASLVDAEARAAAAFGAGDAEGGRKLLDAHATQAGELATRTWRELWQRLMVSFIDGSTKTAAKGGTEDCGCTSEHVPFGDAWKEKVVADTGDHYLEPTVAPLRSAATQHDKPAISKLAIKGVAR